MLLRHLVHSIRFLSLCANSLRKRICLVIRLMLWRKEFVLGQASPIGGFAIGAEFGIRPTANNSNKYSFALYTHDLGGTIYQHRINQVGVHEMFNTTTPPTSVLADSFKHYAKDITAGNSAPHWKTENGDEVRLYKQPTPTTLADVITLLTNLGLC